MAATDQLLDQLSMKERVLSDICNNTSGIHKMLMRLLNHFNEIDETYRMSSLDFLALMQFKYDELAEELCANTQLSLQRFPGRCNKPFESLNPEDNKLTNWILQYEKSMHEFPMLLKTVEEGILSTEDCMDSQSKDRFLAQLDQSHRCFDLFQDLMKMPNRFFRNLFEAFSLNGTISNIDAQYDSLRGARWCIEKALHCIRELEQLMFNLRKTVENIKNCLKEQAFTLS